MEQIDFNRKKTNKKRNNKPSKNDAKAWEVRKRIEKLIEDRQLVKLFEL
ncbi:hypothetical protein [Vibrio jasicida]|nr:hypothetical protein [Vibrio jasicida]